MHEGALVNAFNCFHKHSIVLAAPPGGKRDGHADHLCMKQHWQKSFVKEKEKINKYKKKKCM